MPSAIDFYFDFSSPYGYLASRLIEPVAARHGREVRWRPMMLGPALAVTGSKPNITVPVKGTYFERDVPRTVRMLDIPFDMPSRLPVVTLAAARAFYWLEGTSPSQAKPFAEAVFEAYFVADRDITDRAVVASLLDGVGADSAAGLEAIATAEIKDRLKTVTAEAVARGVFGSPYVFVDDEPFWGVDRFDQVERWLETGGF